MQPTFTASTRLLLPLWPIACLSVFLSTGCSTHSPQPSAATVMSSPPKTNEVTIAKGSGSATAIAKSEVSLFDGRTLAGWAITDFAGHGEVSVEDGKLILGNGVMTGVTWTNALPRMNYEISLEAMRVEGNDFFCALTFPV